jgi:hypothetical protein
LIQANHNIIADQKCRYSRHFSTHHLSPGFRVGRNILLDIMDLVFPKKLLGNDTIWSGFRRKYNDVFHNDSSCF